MDKSANQTLCVQFSYSFNDSLTPDYKKVRHMDSINKSFIYLLASNLYLKVIHISPLSVILLYLLTDCNVKQKLYPQVKCSKQNQTALKGNWIYRTQENLNMKQTVHRQITSFK